MDNEPPKGCGCLITIALTIAIIGYIIGQHISSMYRIPRADSEYIGYLSFYAYDTLPSCRVVGKDYLEGKYSSAVFRLDSTDFAKVLEGLHRGRPYPIDADTLTKFISEDTIVIFNQSAIELLRKENIEVEALDFRYNIGETNRLGFKYPDLIVFDQTLYD